MDFTSRENVIKHVEKGVFVLIFLIIIFNK